MVFSDVLDIYFVPDLPLTLTIMVHQYIDDKDECHINLSSVQPNSDR